jgi:DNA-binding NarL/FixJ family response regulator
MQVLIVEDNPAAREHLSRIAQATFGGSAAISTAGDLEQARQQLASKTFGLLLLDLELPDGSGLDLLKELQHLQCTKIITTLYSDDQHLFPALQLGADGYLLKEDAAEVLTEELRKIMHGEPPLSPAIAKRLLSHFRAPVAPESLPGIAPDSTLEEPKIKLSPREGEVLLFLSKGLTAREIAELLNIKWFTVNDHIKSIYRKLNVSSRAEAAVIAAKQGLL